MAKDGPAFPVVESVADFEKIKRIGEGTYGVVCACAWSQPVVGLTVWVEGKASSQFVKTLTCFKSLQTRHAIAVRAR